MDCFQDFCLACDRESVDGPYCSQRCRMADLERATTERSPPVSPTTPSRTSPYSSAAFVYDSGHAPASRLNSTSTTQPSISGVGHSETYFVQHHNPGSSCYDSPTAQRALTPSSSRSSLSSNTSLSNQSNVAMSEQARLELRTYFTSFDQARAAKRRSSTR